MADKRAPTSVLVGINRSMKWLEIDYKLQVALLMLHHLFHPYEKNINYFAYFPVMVALCN